MKCSGMSAALGVSLAFLIVVPTARGGTVAAKKPSELVTLRSLGFACSSGGTKLETRILGDGSQTAFSIPAGMVFVATGLEWNEVGGSGGVDTLVLKLEGPSANNVVATSSGPVGSTGIAGGNVTLTGIVAKSGSQFCWSMNSGVTTVDPRLHGFLAKDK